MVKLKYIVLETILVAMFIFSFGILAGIFIEDARVSRVQNSFAQLEAEILDARLLSDFIGTSDCNLAIKENTIFADNVFYEARLLDKYEESNELTDYIKTQHMKYDLLRAMIWMNSIQIKQRCNATYHDVVYIYKYAKVSLDERARQTVISNILSDLKNQYGDKILLVSMAGDLDLPSIELLKAKYNITELPVIIIDETIKISELNNKSDIEKYI